MNNIEMIPVGQLHHHPENPRLDLGDLTELAESIRANGVMQNLTVVRGHMLSKAEWTAAARAEGADKVSAEASWDPENAWVCDGYTVVIGNRRMEAAKKAGLSEVPCVVSDMDHRTQISTMLMENMQRADLTVYEQAQGFQMMMDLGFSAEEIAEKTGFGETTVRRRLKMAELDRDTLKKAVGKQITMDDLDRLARVKDIKKRNELLKDYGENNFTWNLTTAIRKQDAAEKKPAAQRILKEAKLERIKPTDRYSGKYRKLYSSTCHLWEWDGKRDFIPKEEGTLFYDEDDYDIDFYLKEAKQKSEAPKKTEAEKEEEKRIENAWKTVERSAGMAAEARKAFAEGMNVSPKNAMRMMQWALTAAFLCMVNYETPTLTIKKELGLASAVITEQQAEMYRKLMELPQSRWPGLILMLFCREYEGRGGKPPFFADGTRAQFPKYKKNVMLEVCYEWLTEFGYEMSGEEIEMMAGTHPVFQTEVKA